MTFKKKIRPTPCNKCYNKFLEIDMFGEQINFNINGQSHYDTLCGTICTLLVILITVFFGFFTVMRATALQAVPEVHREVKRDYYAATGREAFQIRQDSETDPFAFAVALTQRTKFKKPASQQSASAVDEAQVVDESLEFVMRYEIQGDEETDGGKTFQILFKPCEQANWDKFYLNERDRVSSQRQKDFINSHIEHDTFWCPDAFDLSFWGTKGDLDSKTLTMDFTVKEPEKLDGKELLLLINNKKAVYPENDSGWSDSENGVRIEPYTSMLWLPASMKAPQLTTITYSREKLFKL